MYSPLILSISRPAVFAMALLLMITGCDSRATVDQPASNALDSHQGAPSRREFRPKSTSPQTATAFRSSVQFTDVSSQLDLLHRYENGASNKRLMVEATGGGTGWLDYDNDGLLDAYFPQGGSPDGQPAERPQDQLFRGHLPDKFQNVTTAAFLGDREYSQGVTVGDFDNDGFADIFVTNVGCDVLYHNLGDGTFENVTSAAGVQDNLWSSSAAWGDLDLDGDLDLYVCHYLKYDPHHPLPCPNKDGTPSVCHPRYVESSPDECFENLGDGTFRAVSREKGLYGSGNKGLGVAIGDFNNDGLPDIYVANDTTANFLFINTREQGFRESAISMGCALSGSGAAQASMGVGIADYDRNEYLDIYLTHFTAEHNTLYQNLGPQGFLDVSPTTGMRSLTLSSLGFGTVLSDFDQDGQMDAFCANGHIDMLNDEKEPYAMPPLLLTFDGMNWRDVSKTAGRYFQGMYVGRGTAAGDFDNDGDLDLLVGHQNSNAALLRNDSERGHWLKLKLIGNSANRDAVGTRVAVSCGEMKVMQERVGGTSYASAHDSALIFGLGSASGPCSLDIRWPGGRQQNVTLDGCDQTLVLIQPLDE